METSTTIIARGYIALNTGFPLQSTEHSGIYYLIMTYKTNKFDQRKTSES